ncbi:MAG: hypothetical protein QXK06_05335 [Candidatus Diapherotrites archaeon]
MKSNAKMKAIPARKDNAINAKAILFAVSLSSGCSKRTPLPPEKMVRLAALSPIESKKSLL